MLLSTSAGLFRWLRQPDGKLLLQQQSRREVLAGGVSRAYLEWENVPVEDQSEAERRPWAPDEPEPDKADLYTENARLKREIEERAETIAKLHEMTAAQAAEIERLKQSVNVEFRMGQQHWGDAQKLRDELGHVHQCLRQHREQLAKLINGMSPHQEYLKRGGDG